MRRLPPHKLRNIMFMFLGTGAWGVAVGYILPSLLPQPSPIPFYLTILGVIQLGLGGAFGWMYLTRGQKGAGRGSRPKKRR